MPFGDNTQYFTGGKLSVQEADSDLTHAFTFTADQVRAISAGTGGKQVTLTGIPEKGVVEKAVVYSPVGTDWGINVTCAVGAQGDSDGLVTLTATNNGALAKDTGALSSGAAGGATVSNGSITADFSGGALGSISTGAGGAVGKIVVGLRVVDPTRFA